MSLMFLELIELVVWYNECNSSSVERCSIDDSKH